MTVISLDVGVTAGAGGNAADPRSAQAQAQADGRPGGARGDQTPSLDPDPDDLLETAPVVRLPAGALVDVQA